MSRWITLSLLALAALALAACSPAAPKEVAAGDSDNGKTIALNTGDSLALTLEGNPTTGYLWEVETVDAALLKQYGEGEFKPNNKALLGSPGKQTLAFQAVKAGATTLKLVYHRPWEKGVPPDKTFEINVTVK